MQTRTWDGTGRPTAGESLRRKAHFLGLVADGIAVLDAAREARVKPERALAIISSPEEFQVAVDAVRAGAVVVVVTEPRNARAA